MTVDALLDISQLRAMANSLGVMSVMWRKGELVMRVDNRYIPEPAILLQAMQETDKRLVASNGVPPAILLRDPALPVRDMLKEAVKVMKKLTAKVKQLEAEQKEK